ncbi:hypothetical protein HK100_010128, partial [Physocladia obscura]
NILEITRLPLPIITLSIKYMHRLRQSQQHNRTTKPSTLPYDETRIFSVALIVAQKASDDMPYGNRVWSRVLGLDARELTHLEREFLAALKFSLHVHCAEYAAFCRGVQALAREWNMATQNQFFDRNNHCCATMAAAQHTTNQFCQNNNHMLETPRSSTDSLASSSGCSSNSNILLKEGLQQQFSPSETLTLNHVEPLLVSKNDQAATPSFRESTWQQNLFTQQ